MMLVVDFSELAAIVGLLRTHGKTANLTFDQSQRLSEIIFCFSARGSGVVAVKNIPKARVVLSNILPLASDLALMKKAHRQGILKVRLCYR